MIKCFTAFFLFLTIFSCHQKKESSVKEKDNVVRSYARDGKLKTEISMKSGLKDGICKNYYSNGKVSLEMTYEAGKRHGWAKRYYETGILYQETEYKNDKIDGIRKKYWEDGKLMSEEHFVDDFPCNSLKEYQTDGSMKMEYPTIIITPVDRLREEGSYVLNLSLSNKSKRVKYYKGKLSPSGCLTGGLEPLLVDSGTGIGQVRYYLSPGAFQMEEVHVIAAFETSMRNTFLAQKSYNLSIEN